MNLLERRLSRRDFLKVGTAFSLAASLEAGLTLKKGKLQVVQDIADRISPTFELGRLESIQALSSDFPLPEPLNPICFNSPFLWRVADCSETLDRFAIKVTRITGMHHSSKDTQIRIFIDDAFENPVGQYHPAVLEQVKILSRRFPLIPDLFDAYQLLHSDKSACYPSRPITSPYLDLLPDDLTERDKQLQFFTDPDVREAILERIAFIVNALKDEEGIVAWSVGNEFDPPVDSVTDKKTLLTPFYEDAVRLIRSIDRERPILSGVADPNFLDEEVLKEAGLTANTIHVYDSNKLPAVLGEYRRKQHLPLVCQEIGLAGSCNGFNFKFAQDFLFYGFLQDVFSNFIEVDQQNGTYKPQVTSLWPWQLTVAGLNEDGFEIEPDRMQMSCRLLQSWQRIIQKRV